MIFTLMGCKLQSVLFLKMNSHIILAFFLYFENFFPEKNKTNQDFVKKIVESEFVKTCDELFIGSSEDEPLNNKRKKRNKSNDNNEHIGNTKTKKLSKEEMVAALGSELNSENEEDDDGITKEEKEEIKNAIDNENQIKEENGDMNGHKGSDFVFQNFSQSSQIFSHERNRLKNDISKSEQFAKVQFLNYKTDPKH